MNKHLIKIGLPLLCIGFSFSAFGQTTGDAITKKVGLYVFPANDQTSEQQEKDKSDCYTWAVQQSNYDPINPTVVQANQVPTGPDGAAITGAAGGAAVGAAIGAISGDTGKGAAIGAVSGAVLGRRSGNMAKASAQGRANNEAAQTNKNLEDGFKKAFTACLEAKGYTVK
jgi:hypothetical protein